MAILKSRDRHIPGGFKFTQPQTNWSIPEWRSFQSGVQAIIDHRNGNPAITQQHNLSTDYDTVALELDEFNAALCVVNEWYDFIQENNSPKLFPPRPFQAKGAVAGAKRTLAGINTLKDWFGDGLEPVPQVIANARAAVCKACPKNTDPNWLQKINAEVAAYVKTRIEIKNDMELKTPDDEFLFSCSACDCWNQLKVWTPLEHVRKNTSDAVKARLDPKCWVIREES